MNNKLKRKILKFWGDQGFYPTLLGAFLNPFFIARRGLKIAVAEFSPHLKGRLLDVGCGSKPYERLFQVEEYLCGQIFSC